MCFVRQENIWTIKKKEKNATKLILKGIIFHLIELIAWLHLEHHMGFSHLVLKGSLHERGDVGVGARLRKRLIWFN